MTQPISGEIPRMPLVRIKGNFQVTIPASIRKRLGIVVGDYLKVEESRKEAFAFRNES